jgi:small subunit ribosomal protein S9
MATKTQYYYGLGRRKSSTATSRLFAKGKGEITINNAPALEYFDGSEYLVSRLQKPFVAISTEGQFDVTILVKGGGHSAQVDAIVLAISRSLAEFNEDYRSTLKRAGLSNVILAKKSAKNQASKELAAPNNSPNAKLNSDSFHTFYIDLGQDLKWSWRIQDSPCVA